MAPTRWAEPWDRVGLHLGDRRASIGRVVVALEMSDGLLRDQPPDAQLLYVLHHPLLFRPLESVRYERAFGQRLAQLLTARAHVYAMHTNWDAAPNGLNDALAKRVSLTQTEPLTPLRESIRKLVVFVPMGHQAAVEEALFSAGAGRLGDYSRAAFVGRGEGTFQPGPTAQPYLGQVGSVNRVSEVRLEMVVPEDCQTSVLAALRAAHPYEQPAYEMYTAEQEVQGAGLGRIGILPQPMTLSAFVAQVSRALDSPQLRWAGHPQALVQRVAVVGGAGGSLVAAASAAAVDVLVTADVGHHRFEEARDHSLAVVDAGHFCTELPGVLWLGERIKDLMHRQRLALEVHVFSGTDTLGPQEGALDF